MEIETGLQPSNGLVFVCRRSSSAVFTKSRKFKPACGHYVEAILDRNGELLSISFDKICEDCCAKAVFVQELIKGKK
jgi:hypothetical protein